MFRYYYKRFLSFVNALCKNSSEKDFRRFLPIDKPSLRGYNVAMKENYDKAMRAIFQEIPKGTRLLLHSCCAPCSSACLETLRETFSVTVFYYNPNIDEDAEYEKRKAEQIRFLRETGWADFYDCDHDAAAFARAAKGLEGEPERGRRCYRCYGLRLEETARVAGALGFHWFCSTLSLSPYKNADWVNELGVAAGEKYGVRFLPSDFKKRGGYYRSLELSAQYGLYRQNFCGCKYSREETERKRARRAGDPAETKGTVGDKIPETRGQGRDE